MTNNNGWYSIFDKERQPESGKEYLCLAALYQDNLDSNPFDDPENRVYFVATWYEKGDTYYDETADVENEMDIFGKPVTAQESGFYIQQPQLHKRKNTRGGKLPPYCICKEWYMLKPIGQGMDNLVCWKELDAPELQ